MGGLLSLKGSSTPSLLERLELDVQASLWFYIASLVIFLSSNRVLFIASHPLATQTSVSLFRFGCGSGDSIYFSQKHIKMIVEVILAWFKETKYIFSLCLELLDVPEDASQANKKVDCGIGFKVNCFHLLLLISGKTKFDKQTTGEFFLGKHMRTLILNVKPILCWYWFVWEFTHTVGAVKGCRDCFGWSAGWN